MPRNKFADIIRYRNTCMISVRLLGCLHMSPLHDVALDDVHDIAIGNNNRYSHGIYR